MNNRGQFSIIAALLVAIVLIGTLIAVYAMIRYDSSQNQPPQSLTATDETNLAIQKALGFTVGYYGSMLQVTGNQTYAEANATAYMNNALQYIQSMNPSWGESISMTSLNLRTDWFSNPSISQGQISVVYDLTNLGIDGINYTTSCSLGVQIFRSPNSNQVCLNVTQDSTEPLTSLGQQNFAFYSYNYTTSNWQLENPTLGYVVFTNGTYLINTPSGIESSAFMVQVTDLRGIMVEASSYNSYNLDFTFGSQSMTQNSPVVVQLLQNGTMQTFGQDLVNTTQALPIPPIPVKSLNLCQTGSTSDIPFQVEDWASGYQIPLGLTSNYTIFSNSQMIVFEVTPSQSQLTLWWNGNDVAIQPSAAYTDKYFTADNSATGTLSNGQMTLQFALNSGNSIPPLTAKVGTISSTTNFMRINGNSGGFGSGFGYVIIKGVVRDIVQGEAEWGGNGIGGCPNVYSQIVLTLPANTNYFTYQLRLIFINSTARTVSDLSPLQLTTSISQPQAMTENGVSNGIPIVSNSNGYFSNSTGSAHHWSELINSGQQGTGIMFTSAENQQLYAFDSKTSPHAYTGALYVNAATPTIELDPVTSAGSVSFTSPLDLTWYGAVATFNGANPIYTSSGNSGLWSLVEQPPTVTIYPQSSAGASIVLSPTSDPVGTLVTVLGGGFSSGSQIKITFNGQTVGTATATAYGTIPLGTSFTVPSSAPGSYTVTATDTSSNSGSATFTIVPSENIAFQLNGVGTDAGTSTVLTIDSVPYTLSTLPPSFNWPAGSVHTIAASSTDAAGTGKQYAWLSWSNGGAQTQTYIVPTSSATLTVNYNTQYYLTVSSAYGSQTGQGWYNSGSTADFNINTPVSGGSGTQYLFTSWTGGGTGSYGGTNNPGSVVMNNPITETAAWTTQYQATFAVTPSGTGTTTPSVATWYNAGVGGQQITATANSGYTFLYWSASPTGSVTFANSGSSSTTMTVNSANAVVEATFAVISGPLAKFAFSTIGTQTVGSAFQITVTAQDASGNTVTGYTGSPTLTYSAGTVSPGTIGPFTYGVWTGSVTLVTPGTGVALTATGSGESGTSNKFEVTSALALDTSSSADADTSTIQLSLTTTQPNDVIYVSAAIGKSQTFGAITSTPSLTWTSRASITNSVDSLETWYAIMPSAGSVTISISLNGGASHWAATVFAVSGANTASPFDGTAQTNSGDSGTASASITTTQLNDFVIGTLDTSNTNSLTAGTGFTVITTGVYSGFRQTSNEYEIGTTAGKYTPTYTFTTNNWNMIADAIQAATSPSITLTPTSGSVGSTVTVSGSYFAANSAITVKFAATTVATTTSTSTGVIPSGVTFTVPSSGTGAQTVTVTDAYSNSATATFTVASIALSPTSGVVGSTVTVSGSGFVPSHSVTITYDGSTVATTTSTSSGSIPSGVSFSVPASVAGSNTVQASDGTNSATATFTITSAISLSPTSGTVGSTVTITATGMLGSHSVTATFAGTAVTLSTSTTTSTGGLSATFTVPSATSGSNTVQLSDGTNSPTATFTVTSAISLSPTSGTVGSTVTITATGMLGSHSVTATFAGTAVTLSTSTTTSTGGLSATFTVPSASSGGQTVQLTDGTNSPTATFTVISAISLSPTSGSVGSTVTITATGMHSSSAVTAKFGSTAVTLSTSTTTSTGGLLATFTVPSAVAGAQTVTLTDNTNSPTASFTVTPAINLSPSQGATSVKVKVTGNGFAANSAVTIQFDGTTVNSTTSTSTGAIPSSGVIFTVPSSAIVGSHTVTATDGSSNSASATFIVTGTPAVVASNQADADTSTVQITLTTTLPNELVYVSADIGTSQTFGTPSSTPSVTWTSRASITSGDLLGTWYAIIPSAEQVTISIPLNNGASHWAATAFAVSGENIASPFDGTAKTNSGDSGTASASITTSHANDLIIGVLDAQGTNTLTVGHGFTLITTGAYTNYRETSAEYETVSATGTYTPSYTFASTNWGMIADAIQGVP